MSGREVIARAIYESASFYGNDPGKPPWVPGGNSMRQDEARTLADAILAALEVNELEVISKSRDLNLLQKSQDLNLLHLHFGGPEQYKKVAQQLSLWGRENLPSEIYVVLSTSFGGVLAMHSAMLAAMKEKEE